MYNTCSNIDNKAMMKRPPKANSDTICKSSITRPPQPRKVLMASWRPALTLKTLPNMRYQPNRHLTWQQPSLLCSLDGCLIWLTIVILEEGPGSMLTQCARQHCTMTSRRDSREPVSSSKAAKGCGVYRHTAHCAAQLPRFENGHDRAHENSTVLLHLLPITCLLCIRLKGHCGTSRAASRWAQLLLAQACCYRCNALPVLADAPPLLPRTAQLPAGQQQMFLKSA